jgi:membrane protease YdiL (CAAX protease family)
MNHLESAFSSKNNLWRYIVTIVVIFVVINTIGSIPLILSLVLKSGTDPSVFTELAENPQNLGLLGLGPNMTLFVMIFPFLTGLIAFILLIRPFHNRTFSVTVNGTGTIRWSRFFISASVWVVIQSIFLIVYFKADPGNFTLNNTSPTLITLIVISLLIIPFQASFEEVIFRGYFMQGFAVLIKNRWSPLLITSLLFGLLHAFNPEVKEYGFLNMIPQYVLFGLIFGVITLVDDGIEAAMGAHTANNIFVCIMVTQKSAALQTPALFEQNIINPWTDFLGLLISGIVFFFVLKIIFKWENISIIAGKISGKKEEGQIV